MKLFVAWKDYHVCTVYPKKYAHGFVVLCFVVVMKSFIMNSHEVFIHIHQGCFAGKGAIVRLPQCQWSKPDGYGKISQCITTTKHSKAKTVCIFLGIYCTCFRVFCGIKHFQVQVQVQDNTRRPKLASGKNTWIKVNPDENGPRTGATTTQSATELRRYFLNIHYTLLAAYMHHRWCGSRRLDKQTCN